jgi:hypothetical protein
MFKSNTYLQCFIPNLKEHLLPRIMAVLQEEKTPSHCNGALPQNMQIPSASRSADRNCIFFKSDRMYQHHLLRINYTTYDVRRSQDVINPGTSRRDIMVLANDNDNDSQSDRHPFWYARVLGIYHVNVVYTGPGTIDYLPRRMDFLWVRWFQYGCAKTNSWDENQLDPLFFPPMATDGAFGFVDPTNVLRASHIIPAFASGRIHADLVSLSKCAGDSHDWKRYVVNRYVRVPMDKCLY